MKYKFIECVIENNKIYHEKSEANIKPDIINDNNFQSFITNKSSIYVSTKNEIIPIESERKCYIL